VLGPVLEGIRYEAEDTPIDEMFSQLLSRALDSGRVNEAHPAYPILIKQLSPDEAIILSKLYDAKYVGPVKIEADALPRDGLAFPENVPFYFEHLNQLGLAGIFQQGNQEPLYDGPPITKQIGVRVRSNYRLTDFGRRFIKACTEGHAG
jgi:Abortive infection alpha